MVTLPSSMGIPRDSSRSMYERRNSDGVRRITRFTTSCNQIHEDIRIFDSVSGAWANSRSTRRKGTSANRAFGVTFDVPVI